MARLLRVSLVAWGILSIPMAARAAVPTGYKGMPFDPAVVGGVGKIPTTVKAGPYAIPGRLELENYDMGGEGIAYHTTEHYTDKNGDGYRIDRPTATMCMTDVSRNDLWYDTGTALDGTMYPNSTDHDFYIGSIHPGDWMNYTVDVKTAGTYSVSSTFSTGNGPPGGEGGDGSMEMKISVGGTMLADWKTVFPNEATTANYHNWKPYPSFATVTLAAGLQVIRIDLTYQHLNLDYLEFALMGADGGAGGGGGAAGITGSGGTTGTAGTTGTGGTTGAAGTAGTGAAGAGATGGASGGGGGSTSSGGAGATGAGTGGASGSTSNGAGSSGTGSGGSVGSSGGSGGAFGAKSSSSGCVTAGSSRVATNGRFAAALLLACALVARRRRR